MSLNKKQKKELDVDKKRLEKLRVLLVAARAQPDDPQEPIRLQQEIATLEARIRELKQS